MKMMTMFAAMVAIIAIAGETDLNVDKAKIHALADAKSRELLGVESPKVFAKTSRAISSPVIKNIRCLQRSDSFLVDVFYDLISEYNCTVSCSFYNDGTPISSATFDTTGVCDLGFSVSPGVGKHFVWDAGKDWKGQKSDRLKVSISATENSIPASWARITISWDSYGGRDLDICGYWEGTSGREVGWSWGSGSTDSAYKARWDGDNTGSGPEYIHIAVQPNDILQSVTTFKYKVHCNYFGSAGSSSKAKISVLCDGITKSKVISVSNRNGNKATKNDPCVTILFDSNGHLIAIN